ncbi:hypothetical protein GOV10_06895 [Candidatus Woesearchaeota archaeon]|nr:hypothetical protein [Candidatus Woesearchaeota archaeon]
MSIAQFPTDITAILSALIDAVKEDLPGHMTLNEFIENDGLEQSDCLVIGLRNKEPQAYSAYAFLFKGKSYDLPFAQTQDLQILSSCHFPDVTLKTLLGQNSELAQYLHEGPFLYHCDNENITEEQYLEGQVIQLFSAVE